MGLLSLLFPIDTGNSSSRKTSKSSSKSSVKSLAVNQAEFNVRACQTNIENSKNAIQHLRFCKTKALSKTQKQGYDYQIKKEQERQVQLRHSLELARENLKQIKARERGK